VIGRFRPYRSLLRPDIGKFWLGIITGLIAGAASGAGLPLMMQEVFPIIFAGEDGSFKEAPKWLREIITFFGSPVSPKIVLMFACGMLPVVFIFRGLGTFFSTYLISYVGVSVLEKLRLKCFAKLQHLPLSFHSKMKGGDLMSRIMGDTTILQQALVQASVDIIVQPFTLLWAIGYLIVASLENQAVGIILIALLSVPLCVLPIRIVGKKLLKKAKLLQAETGDLNAVLSENLASQPEVRAYNMQDSQISYFSKLGQKFVRTTMKTIKYKRLTSPLIEIVSAFGIAVAIYYGSKSGLTLEQFLPVVAALFFCYEPVKKLGTVQNRLKQGEASLNRLELILNADDSLPNPINPQTWETIEGAISFKDVSFSYKSDSVLSDLSFEIAAGSTVALVGASGAGKTTVVNLIERFYDVNSGSVSIDGIDVRDVDVTHLRDQIAFVSQNPILFSGTIEENIRIGKSDATQEEVIKAAQDAYAHDFISQLPDGYNTHLGERGTGLSGGQRQRIAIARANLKNAPILILDEATSALDAESESHVHDAFMRLSRGRTTLIIAHRFSSIRAADRILVFEKRVTGGAITGDGTHEDLLESHNAYRDLYEKQMLNE